MGMFYHPPQPPRASTAGTPPLPDTPIPEQGAQPPRIATSLVVAMAVISSWPPSLEPRLHAQNAQQTKIAPLTLATGDQPVAREPRRLTDAATSVLAWTLADPPVQRRQTLLPQGDQPPPHTLAQAQLWTSWSPTYSVKSAGRAGLSVNVPVPILAPILARQIWDAWSATWRAQTGPPCASWNVPSIIPVQVQSRPAGWLDQGIWQSVFAADVVEVVDTFVVVPLSAVDQPPPQGPITATELVVNAAWPRDWSAPQRLTQAAQPSLTTPPVPSGPLTVTELSTLASAWVQTWPTQSADPNAAWNIPAVPILARTPPPKHLWTAWEPPPPLPVRPVEVIIAALPSVTNPPPVKALSGPNLMILTAPWQPNWSAQFVPPVQVINVPGPTFKTEWAQNSNQLVGPRQDQPVTH